MNKMIGDLVGLFERQVVELSAMETGAFKVNHFNYPSFKFATTKLIVERVTKIGEGGVQLSYFDGTAPRAATVPSSFLLKILTPEQAADILKDYVAHMMKNISVHCTFAGKIGSDPELFVEDKKGELIPAFKFLTAKSAPYLAPERRDHFEINYGKNAVYWDGFQAEFETAPSGCMGWHADSIQCGLQGVLDAARIYNPKAKLSIKTVVDIPTEMMIEAAPEHVAFGCMPSFNAYGMKGLETPGQDVPFRCAGGHIHFSLNNKPANNEVYVKMVKALDGILGVACVSLFAQFDDPRRRTLYGLAGEYRLPPHGMEYRTLSNAWLSHPVIANIVFDLARSAAMMGAKDLFSAWQCTEAETIRIINECDVEAARKVLATNKDLMVKLLNVKYYNPDYSNWVFGAFMNGMESIIADPTDLEKNWGLGKEWIRHCDGKNKNVAKTLQMLTEVPYKPGKI